MLMCGVQADEPHRQVYMALAEETKGGKRSALRFSSLSDFVRPATPQGKTDSRKDRQIETPVREMDAALTSTSVGRRKKRARLYATSFEQLKKFATESAHLLGSFALLDSSPNLGERRRVVRAGKRPGILVLPLPSFLLAPFPLLGAALLLVTLPFALCRDLPRLPLVARCY